MCKLIHKLEVAVLQRNPALAESLQPGLPVERIKKELKRAGIMAATDPLIELYSWHNGTVLHGYSNTFEAGYKAGFIPPAMSQISDLEMIALGSAATALQREVKCDIGIKSYHFIELKRAIQFAKGYNGYAKYNPRLSVLEGRYFPILWDGSDRQIALDIEPSGHHRYPSGELRQ
jgi:hypothetical protein